MKYQVKLTQLECDLARFIGSERNRRATENGRTPHRGDLRGDTEAIHILGAAGELAFAKAANIYPTGVGHYYEQDDDVGGIQIRTRSNPNYELYIWPHEPKNAMYVLLTGTMPDFTLVGWIHGTSGKQDQYWTPKKHPFPKASAYVIPQSDLRELRLPPFLGTISI